MFLHPSPPSIAAPAAGGLCLQPTMIRSGHRRLGTASPPGHAGVSQQQLVQHPLLSTMALGPTGPLDHLPGGLTPRPEFPGRGRVRSPPRPLILPPRRSRRCLIPSDRDRAEPVGTPLLRLTPPLLATHCLHLPSWMTVPNTAQPRPRRASENSSLTAHAPSWRHNAYICQDGCPWRRCLIAVP